MACNVHQHVLFKYFARSASSECRCVVSLAVPAHFAVFGRIAICGAVDAGRGWEWF